MELITQYSKSGKSKYFAVKLDDGFLVEMRSKKAASLYIQTYKDAEIQSISNEETNNEILKKSSIEIPLQLRTTCDDQQPITGDGECSADDRTTQHLSGTDVPKESGDAMVSTTSQKQKLLSLIESRRQKSQGSDSQLPSCIRELLDDSRHTVEQDCRELGDSVREGYRELGDSVRKLGDSVRELGDSNRELGQIAKIAIGAARFAAGINVGGDGYGTERTIHEPDVRRIEPETIDVLIIP